MTMLQDDASCNHRFVIVFTLGKLNIFCGNNFLQDPFFILVGGGEGGRGRGIYLRLAIPRQRPE